MHFGALEAGGTKMVCAIGNENGQILERVSIPTETPEKTMPALIDFFKDKGLAAIGIGCFGPVDLDKNSKTYGFITSTPKLSWKNYPIVAEFEKALGIPVGFDTDVNAAALGEAVWGCTKTVKNSIYITVGTGVGVGVIIDGKPYHGMIHPEGGHIFISRRKDDPMEQGICPYHATCLEGLASGPAIEKRWGVKGAALSDRKEVWELEAYYLGQAICTYIMTLSPERIILGGGVMHQQQLLPMVRREVQKQMCGYVQGKGMDNLDEYIVPISLNDNQGAMGCIKLAMDAWKEKGEAQ
ncbi:MAG: ROK family protein [Oscillospiraceae bacterium]|nr:ROK family protein [Oscillospiraceae bacterium]